MGQWILIMTLSGVNGSAINNAVFYDEESCHTAEQAFKKQQYADAFCVPRKVGEFGEIRIDKSRQ